MSLSREQMLDEMGLSPHWTLRGQPTVARGAKPVPTVVPTVKETLLPISSRRPDEHPGSLDQLGWEELRQTIAACRACVLCAERKQAVAGFGDENADWLFVGEGPGAEEDAQGEPFVGQAGKLLDAMLAAIDLRRGEDVYIANIVKCRPPDNRVPEPDEAETCVPFLIRQIELIKPKVLVLLGATPAKFLLKAKTINEIRGKWQKFMNINTMPTYHPAFLLRNPSAKKIVWEDLKLVMKELGRELPK